MRFLGLFVVFALVMAACGDDADTDNAEGADTSTSAPPVDDVASTTTALRATDSTSAGTEGPLTVTQTIVTLTDESRVTPATAAAAERPTRMLETHIYEPDGEGPWPLIVFAHGLDGHPRKFTILHQAWAEAGYVVAAPTFPVSNDQAPGGGEFTDLDEQPGDMSFVLDQLLGPDSSLSVEVDADRIVAAGLSLGGATVYGMVYDDCCRDPRIMTAMVLDGNEFNFDVDLTSGPPLLIVHADGDPALPYDAAAASYAATEVPAAFLTLHAVTHAAPFENDVDPTDDVVNEVLLAWLDHYAGQDPNALARIDEAVDAARGLASWESKLS